METVSYPRGRGRGSRPRPGPPSWPHGTAAGDRGKYMYAPHSNEAAESCEQPDVDWDEMRRQVSEVLLIQYAKNILFE